jgi:hypothetical protein
MFLGKRFFGKILGEILFSKNFFGEKIGGGDFLRKNFLGFILWNLMDVFEVFGVNLVHLEVYKTTHFQIIMASAILAGKWVACPLFLTSVENTEFYRWIYINSNFYN